MKTYLAEIRHKGVFLERLCICAPDRGTAVHKAQLHFWYKYRGRLGTSAETMFVNDPYNEVAYSPTFKCKDKKNILLPEEVIKRLIIEACGELVRDTRIGRPHHSRGSVMRRKRRRDFGKFIAPSIRRMKNGRLYYRINIRPQIKRGGRRLRKRKYSDIPLYAINLSEAAMEIEEKQLAKLNAKVQKRKLKFRDVRILKWLSGLAKPPTRIPRAFRRIFRRYSEPIAA